METPSIFNLMTREISVRHNLAEQLLAILQARNAIPEDLDKERQTGGDTLYQLLFGRGQYMPVLIPTAKENVFQRLVHSFTGNKPAAALTLPEKMKTEALPVLLIADLPLTPLVRPEEPPSAPEELDPLDEEVPNYVAQVAAAAPEPIPEPIPEPELPAPVPLEPPTENKPAMSDSTFNMPTPVYSTGQTVLAGGVQASAGEVARLKFLQKVAALLHSGMANRDTYPKALAEESGIPLSVIENLASGNGGDVSLGSLHDVMTLLGASNLILAVPNPRQPPAPAR